MGTSLEDSDSPSTGIWFDGGRAENGEGTGQRYHALSPSFFYYASPIGQHKAELGIDAEAGSQNVQAEPFSRERLGFAV